MRKYDVGIIKSISCCICEVKISLDFGAEHQQEIINLYNIGSMSNFSYKMEINHLYLLISQSLILLVVWSVGGNVRT